MPKFRKRPVIIEAERVWEREAIITLEGVMTAEAGDWIITGVKGEPYPCKDDIFRLTYEAIDVEGEDALLKEQDNEG